MTINSGTKCKKTAIFGKPKKYKKKQKSRDVSLLFVFFILFLLTYVFKICIVIMKKHVVELLVGEHIKV